MIVIRSKFYPAANFKGAARAAASAEDGGRAAITWFNESKIIQFKKIK